MAYTKDFVYFYDIFKDERTYLNIVNKLVRIFKKHNVKTVLDIGCGTGKIDYLLKKKGYSVVGIDNSKEMIKYAKKQYPKITFKLMSAQTFKLNKKFDAIIALDSVLTYLTKKGEFEKAIKNIVGHMKKGSILYFLTGFTERQIPPGFTDHFFKRAKLRGRTYKKEYIMKRQKNLLLTTVRIYENKKVVVEENHDHRIISEKLVLKLLKQLNCEVKIIGNSKGKEHSPMHVIAKKIS
ncbi:class I SAM-dependent methyltransferase [Candidatus Woesearchaeota archaeon]|nr:class I SAM-dependent methyltransferase [Candidatus Woesearchaeota archaeon]